MVNAKQRDAIEACKSMLDMWLYTNDLMSPSHWSLIDDMVFDLEEKLDNSANAELIGHTLSDLLTIIKNLK